MRTLVVMQPTYLPWLGYFDLMRRSDLFVIYDTAQFSKQSWQQRNRVRDKKGEIILTVPVLTKGKLGQPISEVAIDRGRDFAKKHLDTIRFNYSKAPHFKALFPELEAVYSQKRERLLDLNLDLIELGRRWLGVATPMKLASEIGVEGGEVDALIDMCRKTESGRYLSPAGAKGYIELNNRFGHEGIELVYQDYAPPTYAQQGCADFISHLSFIDYVFNAGPGGF